MYMQESLEIDKFLYDDILNKRINLAADSIEKEAAYASSDVFVS